MCNNNGHCRKFDAGTMCPSYRVTRDEEHLTRGRANTLRLALSGQLGPELASRPVRAALDLCVSCKGCRRDCPTGVDMAKMKIEFLYHWQRAHGLALKDRARRPPAALGAVGGARCRGSPTCATPCPGAKRLGERWLGCRRGARCRTWRRDTFLATRHARRERRRASADVVLFVDTFSQLFRAGERARGARRAARRRAIAFTSRARRPTTPSRHGRCAAAAPTSRRASSTRRSAKRAAWSRRWRRTSRAARRSSASSRRACCRCATSSW